MHLLFVDLPLWFAFVLALIACWSLNLFGLPGNWLIVLASLAVALLARQETRLAVSAVVLAVLVLLAILGEIVELAAGAVTTRRAGATRRGAVGSVVGAVVGALAGAVVGLPIPIVGSVVAALLFGATGALVGAMALEWHSGADVAASWRIGQAAFWGRLLGALSKAAIGGVMVVIAAVAAGI